MSRLVHWEPPPRSDDGLEGTVSFSPGGEESQRPAEAYLDRVAKYIPTEVVAAYLAISLLLSGVTNDDGFKLFATWFVYGFGLLFTWLYLSKADPPSETLHGWPRRAQLLIVTGAFAVWGYALGGPFEIEHVFENGKPYRLAEGWHYRQWFGGVVIILYTLFAGLYLPTKPEPVNPEPTKPDPNAGGS